MSKLTYIRCGDYDIPNLKLSEDVYKRQGVDSLKGDDDFTPFRNIMNDSLA